MKWRIYYADGSAYSDVDGPPELAPGWGVQVIAMEDREVGRILIHTFDFYWWDGEGWVGGDATGREDYLAQSGWKKIINGRGVRNAQYQEIMKQAMRDDYLPPKSARAMGEKPI